MAGEATAADVARELMSAVTSELSPLFDLAANGVLALDVDATIVYANAPAERMFGYGESGLAGQPIETLVPSRFVERHLERRRRYNLEPYTRSLGTSDAQLIGLRRDGTEFPIDVAFRTVTRDGVAVTLVTVADLSRTRSVETRLEDVSRAYSTLEAMTRHMIGATDAARVLEIACNLAVTEGRYFGAWAGQATDDGRIVVLASSDSVKDYVSRLDIKIDTEAPGPVATALLTGRATYIENFDDHAADTPWIETARAFGVRASATLPVRCGAEIVAALTFFASSPDVFNAEVRSVLEGIAATVRTYLEHSLAEARLRTVERHRNELLHRLVDAQETERAKIAADVHDDTLGTLNAVQLRLSLLERKLDTAAPDLSPDLLYLREALDGATERLRNLLFDLDAPDPNLDIVDAIRSAAGFLFDGTATGCTVSGRFTGRLDGMSFIQAMRIAKEGMANALAHAAARHVDVAVRDRDGGLEISIRDDGAGFDPSNAARPGHRGLATMRDRAELVGGSFEIQTAREAGTMLRAWLPGEVRPGCHR